MVTIDKPPLSSRRKLLHWTRDVLRKYGVRVKKKLSQSFVVDPTLVHDILGCASRYCRSGCVEEIGSGLGVLTYYLSTRCCRVVAIEIDPLLSTISKEVASAPHVVVVNADALSIPRCCKLVVSNTPYHVSSDIIVSIARENIVEKAVLVLQKEVVERLLARPGSREYGRLTVLVNTLFRLEAGRVYPPKTFYPEPEVYSRLIVFNRVREYSRLHARLEEVTRRLFSMRRKRVSTVVHRIYKLDTCALERLGIDSSKRVYQLCPEEFMALTRYLVERGFI